MNNLTKKGALTLTQDIDRIANVIETEAATLGIPEKVASDFGRRCDMLTGRIEVTAGIKRDATGNFLNVTASDFPPAEIGKEKAGPMEGDSDEPYMRGEFTQQENRELREDVEGNKLGPDKTTFDPQSPTPGVQASFATVVAALKASGKKMSPAKQAKVAQALNLASQVILAEDKDDDDEGNGDEAEAGKKASHGYNLSA